MKKLSLILAVLILMLSLTSCRARYYANWPAKKPMSKWESKTVELYVLEKTPGMTIACYAIWVFKGTGRIFYGEFGPDCSLLLYENVSDDWQNGNLDKADLVAKYYMMGYRENLCKVSGHVHKYSDMLPEHIYFRLTDTDLYQEDLPKFE